MGNMIVGNSPIRINSDGMYSLNDLHKVAIAAGRATESHAPSQFLRNDSVKSFIAVLDSDVQNCTSVKTSKGGKNQGTYAVELVVMKYAGWIDPSYEVQVYQAVQALKRGELDKAAELSGSKSARRSLDDMRHAKAVEMQLANVERFRQLFPNLGERANQAFAAALLNPVIGMDAIPLPRIEEKFYTTTELADELETTGAMLGRLANQNDMKKNEYGEYRLSKSQYSDKQVEQWYWSESGRIAMRHIIEMKRA